jgi:purine nucleosidase
MSAPTLLSEARRTDRLGTPTSKVRMVLDTDAFNEVDDQFAIAYAMASPERLAVEAIYAAPFDNARSKGPGDGMEQSHDEIIRVLQLVGTHPGEGVHRGATRFLSDRNAPVDSAAVQDLSARAMQSPEDDPLYVVAIGAITNIASALLIEPRIAEHIVIVWLGGHALHWPDTREFNLRQDTESVKVVFDSGAPLVWIPCMGVTSHLLTSLAELERHLDGASDIASFLVGRLRDYSTDHFAYTKVIWDIAAIAWLIDPGYTRSEIITSPVLNDDLTWSTDAARHTVRCVSHVYRDLIFKDMFTKLRSGVPA